MPDVRGLGLWKLLLVVAFVCCCQAAHHGAHHHEFLHLLSRQTSSSGFAVVPPGTVANSSIANITTQCVNAMEATVQCDDSLNTIAAADYFLPANATDFQSVCVKACGSSLATYHQKVVSACAGQPQAWDGFPATYFGDLLWATWNLTCLSDSKTGQSCMSYFANISSAYTTDISATALPKSILCSPCVLSMYQVLQQTAYSNYDSAMASDWKSVQSLCGVSYPTSVQQNPTNVTSIAGFAPAGQVTTQTASCFSGNTHTVGTGESCNGIAQANKVSTGALQILNNIFPDCTNLISGQSLCLPMACQIYTVQSGDTCQSITNSSGISFTQFNSWNPSINSFCTNLIAGQQVCVGLPGTAYNGTTIIGATVTQTAVYATATVSPPSNVARGTTSFCGKYYTVQTGDDCSLIALNKTISIGLFESINPSINSDCTNLSPGLAYCVFPTSDWNANTTSGNTTSTYVIAPAPTPNGTINNCFQYHTVVSGDYCGLLENQYGITFAQLQTWNQDLNAACSNLILGDAYCVQGDTSGNGAAAASSTAPVTMTSPGGPTQSGITASCKEYYTVQSGDSCTAVESEFGVTFAQLYSWNPAIGSNCNYLVVGDAICVLGPTVSSSAKSSASTKVATSVSSTVSIKTSSSSVKATASSATPGGPTQSGITANCKQYYTVKSGDSCAGVESTFSISFAQLYAWNPAIGSNCQYLVVGDAVCVSGPQATSTTAAKVSSSSTSTKVAPPGPTQSGTAANCNKYYVVQSGDSCAGVESKYSITFNQLYGWNPSIGSNCQYLGVGNAYCVGVSS